MDKPPSPPPPSRHHRPQQSKDSNDHDASGGPSLVSGSTPSSSGLGGVYETRSWGGDFDPFTDEEERRVLFAAMDSFRYV